MSEVKSWLEEPSIPFVRRGSFITLEQATEFAAYSFLPDGEATGDPPHDGGRRKPSSPPPPELQRYVAKALMLKTNVATPEEIMNWWNTKVRAEVEGRAVALTIKNIQNQTRRSFELIANVRTKP
ncbi:MAG: hypothetical protein AAB853_02965 [Patescibacteria group bacterium]